MPIAAIAAAIVGLLAVVLALSAIRIVRDYERLVVFRVGHLRGARGPGFVLIIPLMERTRLVNLQVHTADIPAQDLITKDNVTIRVERGGHGGTRGVQRVAARCSATAASVYRAAADRDQRRPGRPGRAGGRLSLAMTRRRFI